TDRASKEVGLLRQEVQDLKHMELQQLSVRLQRETRAVTATLRAQAVDFDSVRTMRDAMSDVAKGLNSLAETLDPVRIGKLGTGLGETAAFLEDKVIPSANQAANHLDESTAALRSDAQRLCGLLRDSPPDLKAIREVYESLGRFKSGLDGLNGS